MSGGWNARLAKGEVPGDGANDFTPRPVIYWKGEEQIIVLPPLSDRARLDLIDKENELVRWQMNTGKKTP